MGLVSGLEAYVSSETLQVNNLDNTLRLCKPRWAGIPVWTTDINFSSQKENGSLWGGLQERVNINSEEEFGNKNEILRIVVLVLGYFVFPFKIIGAL